ncbi:MAG: DNA polymerase/3'-5' exonuclease PolX [Ignavibacteria bacterium]|nr:DNA polymerase/3'-5' exonuclease PolX [Ignavibacteria bacterium]
MDRRLLKILRNIATLLLIKGENPFKAEAYSKAADTIEALNIDVNEFVRNGKLSEVKGFGEALVKKITEYVETGKISYYEKLGEEIPIGLVEITKLPNVGPKRAKQFYEELGIKNIDELENACLEGKIAKLKGYSIRTQEIILNSIQHLKARKGKQHLMICYELAKGIEENFRKDSIVQSISLVGEMRRVTEVVSSVDFLIATSDRSKVIEKLKNDYEIIEEEEDSCIFTNDEGVKVKFHFAEPKNFFWNLHNLSGSEEYINTFAKYFEEVTGFKFDSREFPISNISLTSEEQIFEILKLQFIPPELREKSFALERAKNFSIPRLIENSDLRGIIHIHTNWSDGFNTIEEVSLRSKELGFEYVAICDHSQTAKYANGMEIERVLQQIKEIDELNERNLGIKILKGIESDIHPDGSLDYPEEILKQFDIVVVSVHSHFKMSKDEMTRRIVYAIMSPYSHILGHPTGRLLLARESYQVDLETIIQACSDYGKIIELNANPYRLDLPWEFLSYAKEKGVKIAVCPDSHDLNSLSDIFYGLKFARKGWLENKDVVNCLSCDSLLRYVKAMS